MPAAEQLIRRSIAVDPSVAQRHNDLGVALHSLGRLDEAIEALQHEIAAEHGYLIEDHALVLYVRKKR